MLKELLERIQETAIKAAGPFTLLDESLCKTVLIDGEVQQLEKDAPPRHHVAGSLETITRLALEKSVIWHSGNLVCLVLDNSDNSSREDRVTLELTTSEKWRLATTQAKEPRQQKEFIAFLKHNLRDEVQVAAPGLIEGLKKVTFQTNEEGESDVRHGRESMGNLIKREVTGASEFPETIKLVLTRWSELDFCGTIEFALIVDTETRSFALKPLADEIPRAEQLAQSWLGELLNDGAACEVYFGAA